MRLLNILQVNTSDVGGGAEKIAATLHHAYNVQGHNAWMVVGRKYSQDNNIFYLPAHRAYCDVLVQQWIRFTERLPGIHRARGAGLFRKLCEQREELLLRMVKALGYENFHFPATTDLLTRIPQTPDIMHCHNLHGEYFDLRMLPKLSKQLSVVMTLHDAWLFSGHCAHSFDCDRWKIGCGKCPDLSIPPAIQRDATVYNWRKKQQIYANSRLVIVTPSRWLMQKVEQSMLVPAIIRKQVIPNGIDLSVFYPTDKTTVRQKLGIPLDAYVCLFVAHGIHQNRWKDYQSLQTAMFEVSTSSNNSKNPLHFIVLGTSEKNEHKDYYGGAETKFVPLQRDQSSVANYYQAADVYIHAAKVDNFPTTILEALACGLPVIATAVGGIPEQVADGQTGFLVPRGDHRTMAGAIHYLLEHSEKRQEMSQQAVRIARQYFGSMRMVDEYLSLYQKILQTPSY